MTFKTILVQAEAAATPRLETAAALAKAHDAQLIGLGIDTFQPLLPSDPYGFTHEAALQKARARAETLLNRAQQTFERCAQGVDHAWRRSTELPTSGLAKAARAADLIVAGGGPLRGPGRYRSADLGALILAAGRPVLVAPPSGGELAGERVVIAWKDTREARRAARDALPLLVRAHEVIIVAVASDHAAKAAEAETADVAAWLKTHGVRARGAVTPGLDDDVCGELQLQAMNAGADLIVAGGYGHPRFTERLLGGVTRGLLENPQQFVLFSH